MWPSVAAAHVLQGSAGCAIRDALLHTLDATSYFIFPAAVPSAQSSLSVLL